MRVLGAQPGIEARVLAACITNALVLAQLADLEVYDLCDWRNRVVLNAIRNLQLAGLGVDVASVLDEIEAMDLDATAESGVAVHRAEFVNGAWIGLLIATTEPYSDPEMVLADLRQLRAISDSRRA